MAYQFIRLIVIVFLVLTVFYVILSWYSRSIRRGKLEREFDEEVRTGDRDAYIRAGIDDYNKSLRAKLILGVYIIPFILIAGIIYVVNFM